MCSTLKSVSIACGLLFLLIGISARSQTVFTYTGNVQTYTVPNNVSAVTIECYGAQGGDGQNSQTNPGGLGAKISGEFVVTPGETFTVIVGGVGGDTNSASHGGGGGGGSFVIRDSGFVPMVIAGGGGGASSQPGVAGQAGQTGNAGGAGAFTPAPVGEGGLTISSNTNGYGAGGGGWNSDGQSNNWATGGVMQGGAGGTSNVPALFGGYGGGGAGFLGSGGGGGYTGGSAGSQSVVAGGGGSYNDGINQINGVSNLTGDGLVIITPTCLPLNASPVTDVQLCEDDILVLSVSSNTGGTISWDNGVTNGMGFEPPVGNTTYTATSSSAADCPHMVNVVTIAAPIITINATATAVCVDETPVTLTASGAHVYNWNGGVVDGQPFYPPPGNTTYTVIGIDTITGCQNTEPIEIFGSDPSATYVTTPEVAGNDGSIDLTVFNGVSPYTFDWDNDGTGDNDDPEDLLNIPGGNYQVTIKDAIGCIEIVTVKVDSYYTNSLDENELSFALYPNPTSEIVNIDIEGSFSYELLDENGKFILSRQANDQATVDVSYLPTGIYLIRVTNSAGNSIKRVVKQ